MSSDVLLRTEFRVPDQGLTREDMATENLNDADQKKSVDDWLPITSSRNAKWWYSAFHNVTAMVGAGVLSLPYAMAELGWYTRERDCAHGF